MADEEKVVIQKSELFDKIIDEALSEIAQKGVEGVSEKTVTIACFAMLARNSIESLTCEVASLKNFVKRITWIVIPMLFAFLLGLGWQYFVHLASGG